MMNGVKAKPKGKGKRGKVHTMIVGRMKDASGKDGFTATVHRDRMPEDMGPSEPEQRFHKSLNSVKNHMAEAFGPGPGAPTPDQGSAEPAEPDADDN